MLNNKCNCIPGTLDIQEKECKSCHISCKECLENLSKCTSCVDTRELDEDTCKCISHHFDA